MLVCSTINDNGATKLQHLTSTHNMGHHEPNIGFTRCHIHPPSKGLMSHHSNAPTTGQKLTRKVPSLSKHDHEFTADTCVMLVRCHIHPLECSLLANMPCVQCDKSIDFCTLHMTCACPISSPCLTPHIVYTDHGA